MYWHNSSHKNANWDRWLRTCLREVIPNHHEVLLLGKKWNKWAPAWTSNSQQPFQFVSTYDCSTQERWWQMHSNWLQCFEQGHMGINVVLPRVEDIFSKLSHAKYFSTLDLCAGYLHIPLNEDFIPKTAFTSPFEKYKYLEDPFGLPQTPVNFQELMNKVLKNLPFTIVYLNVVTIYSKISEEHLDHLKQVFYKPCNAELSIKLSKSHFFTKENSIFSPCPQQLV